MSIADVTKWKYPHLSNFQLYYWYGHAEKTDGVLTLARIGLTQRLH